MDKPLAAALVLAVLALLLVLMVLGWRARGRRQAGLTVPGATPATAGEPHLTVAGFYVATTSADAPLERIVADRLGFRGRVTVRVFDAGIELAIAGREAIFIAADVIRGFDRASLAIDRVVERDGLTRIRWRLDGPDATTDVDSYLRLPATADLVRAASHLDPHRTTSKSGNYDQ